MTGNESTNVNRYCGPMGLSTCNVLFTSQDNDVQSWFSGLFVRLVHKGRVAIRYAAGMIMPPDCGEIIVPSYNCGSEIDALLKSGCSIVPYRIDRRAAVDMDDLAAKLSHRTKAIYVTHYFGFSPDIEKIRALCDEKGIYLIEDCALSLFSSHNNRKLGTFGDVAIFSLPKTLPVPDGGSLVINNPELASKTWELRKPKLKIVAKNLLPLGKAMVLKYLSHRGSHAIMDTLSSVKTATQAKITDHKMQTMPDSYFFDEAIKDTAISPITRYLLKTFSPEDIVRQRRENYYTFLEALKDADKIMPLYRELPPGVCPLSFPVILPERNRTYAKLTAELIAVIPWWAGYHPDFPWEEYPDARFLKDNLLALPVHQQLSRDDIFFIANRLLKIVA